MTEPKDPSSSDALPKELLALGAAVGIGLGALVLKAVLDQRRAKRDVTLRETVAIVTDTLYAQADVSLTATADEALPPKAPTPKVPN